MAGKLICRILVFLMAFSMVFTGAMAETAPVYLALGDSGSTGYGLAPGEKGFTELVAEANGYDLINRAVNGSVISDVFVQLTMAYANNAVGNADVITITCGGNDLLALLFAELADVFNAANPEAMLNVSEAPSLLANPSDARHAALLDCAGILLTGDEAAGVGSILESEKIDLAMKSFISEMNAVVAAIRKVNPDAAVIVTTQFNPYPDFDGDYAGLNLAADAGVQMLREAILTNEAADYVVADVYSAFAVSTEDLCNSSLDPFNMDVHANALGQAVIAECVNAVIEKEMEE